MAKQLWIRSVHAQGHWREGVRWQHSWTNVHGEKAAQGVAVKDGTPVYPTLVVIGMDGLEALKRDPKLVITATDPQGTQPLAREPLEFDEASDDDNDVSIQERLDRGVKYVGPSGPPGLEPPKSLAEDKAKAKAAKRPAGE